MDAGWVVPCQVSLLRYAVYLGVSTENQWVTVIVPTQVTHATVEVPFFS